MKKLIYLLLIFSATFAITFTSCNNKEDLSEYEVGYLKNLTGLSACGWIIELTDKQKLEPTNLDDFDVPLKENQKIFIQYSIPSDVGSFCMAGKIVEITSLKLP